MLYKSLLALMGFMVAFSHAGRAGGGGGGRRGKGRRSGGRGGGQRMNQQDFDENEMGGGGGGGFGGGADFEDERPPPFQPQEPLPLPPQKEGGLQMDGEDLVGIPEDIPVSHEKRPNVVLLLLDDLGWADISSNGGEIPTPRIDELFDDSIRLHRHYIHMMCSPSRTQYTTGRYAMYQGINKMTPWDYTEIGGVPLGQPMITQWLKTLAPEYRTYGVGKWHLGYAYEGMCPMHRDFDEWYGFLQGAVNYATKLYDDVKYGPTEFYDFWYNDEIDYSAEGPNSMYQYRDRFAEMMTDHKENHEDKPFFVYAPLQAIHGPLRRVEEYADECFSILGKDAEMNRARYCENTFLMDEMVGDMVDSLKDNGHWENTILIFGTDNGANLDNGGVNYPLRGTKGTLFEGNIRTIAFVTGGSDLIPRSEIPEENIRHSLVSNLDWVPTILDFVGLIDDIPKNSVTWDGVSQKDLILYGDKHKKRDHIVLNVGLASLESCSVIFEHKEGNKRYLYKYVHSSDETIDRWSWYRVNGWSQYNDEGHLEVVIDEDEESTYEYLYELYSDEREKHNLIVESDEDDKENEEIALINEDEEGEEINDPRDQWTSIIDKAMRYIRPYTEHALYSERIECLWHRVPNGDPSLIDDGRSVRPFLSKRGYLARVEACFQQDADKGVEHSAKKKALYNNEWKFDPSQGGGGGGKKKGRRGGGKKGGGKHKKKKRQNMAPLYLFFAGVSALSFLAFLAHLIWAPFPSFSGKKVNEDTPLLKTSLISAQ